jgi:hypothetical protein
MDLIRDALGSRVRLADDQLLDQVIDWVRELNGGELDDDLAILALGYSAPDDQLGYSAPDDQ